MRAKKSYGQHFLTSETISERIADSLLRTNDYDKVLEVGPGQGMLTKYLLKKKEYDLTVVEADRDMVSYLNQHYPALRDKIIAEDFLKVDLKEIFGKEQFAIIGNYPYNISSQILFRMLDYREQVPELVGMFQKEVAERVAAPAGNKTYGVVSVLIQAFYDAKYLFTVKPGSFNPPPKVHSAVIRLTRKENYDLACNPKLFKQIVKLSFGQRRKMLRNTMRSIFKDNEILQNEFFKQRPEKLDVAAFVQLTKWAEEHIEKEKGTQEK